MLSLLLALAPAGALSAPVSAYAPEPHVSCPGSTLVRSANGVSKQEASFIASRKINADAALSSWLATALPSVNTSTLPTVALSNSGGGFRALLTGAGVVQALDDRDSASETAGLYQALTYHAGLSGGAWLLSALSAGDWPTVSKLTSEVWETQFAAGILDSSNSTTVDDFTQIATDIVAKGEMGFPVSLTDPWGRMLSYQVMSGGDGALEVAMSDLASLSNFTSHNVPFPLMTASYIDSTSSQCEPTADAAIYEFNPFEFGSWSDDISAFVQTEYLGSNLSGGVALDCASGLDRIDWVLGASSNLLQDYICNASLGVDITQQFPSAIIQVVEEFTPASEYGYAMLPNPFKNFKSTTATAASSVSDLDRLYMVDGGEPSRNIPILPLLEPSRNVDVLIVSENGNDDGGYPDGTSMVSAWTATQSISRLTGRFPAVPAAGSFSTKSAQIFGCDDAEAVTVIYLPNAEWTYPSNTSTLQLQFSAAETQAMIENGNAVATQGGDESWGTCLACAVMLKQMGEANLPEGCAACLEQYCWYA